MSYSRWISSPFYTYWCSSKAKRKEEELFNCHVDLEIVVSLTYEDCRKVEDSLTSIKGKVNRINDDDEARELQGYIKEFIKDVDESYLSKQRGGQ